MTLLVISKCDRHVIGKTTFGYQTITVGYKVIIRSRRALASRIMFMFMTMKIKRFQCPCLFAGETMDPSQNYTKSGLDLVIRKSSGVWS